MSPKPKPDEVIRHELVLGRKEYELVENTLVYPQLIAGVKDLLPYVKDAATAIALIEGIATALELMGIDTPVPTPIDLLEWFQENGYTYNEAKKKWESAKTVAAAIAVGGVDFGSVITGDLVEEGFEEVGLDVCDLPLAGQLAAAGYPPTLVNILRYQLFGPLPGMKVCP
jgi:hypothetical protein